MKPLPTNTICALSTPQGEGAIAVIRLSGANAIPIANTVFFPKDLSKQNSHTIHHGTIKDGETLVDDVMVSVFKSPNTYTGEDVIEISCHASPFIQQSILQLLITKGAIPAQAGEFTKRAFLNGKLDLSQAEAVADLIASDSRSAHQVAMNQMRGGFSHDLKQLREQLLNFASLIELELDFSEEDVEFASRTEMSKLLILIQTRLKQLIDSFHAGNVIKNGVPVVIIGKPNVGKSTLLNVLLNEEKAIVTDIPGTTRDTIEDVIQLGGISFRFIDTAGLRATTDTIETIGVKKTLEKVKQAAIIIYVFDVNDSTHQDLEVATEMMKQEKSKEDAKILYVANKMDISNKQRIESPLNILYLSAKEKQNISHLTDALINTVNIQQLAPNETIITNVRHYDALVSAEQVIRSVQEGIANKLSEDLLSIDVRQALHHIGEITGEVVTEELLGNIFGRFCIGK